jgi:DHA1 family bicyclomycin/chloramphenicol resistance-like MFS transporter
VSLFGFIGMMIVTTFCFGLLFGNLNALSMAPFGKIAGVASGTIGALTMMMGVLVGTFIGLSFNGTILPMLIGFGVASSLALLLIVLFSETRVKKATVVG